MKSNIEAATMIIRLAAAAELLRLITTNADAKRAGTKAHLLAFIIECSPCATQRDLAKRLGVSEGRCSQMLKVFRRHYGRDSAVRLTLR